MSGIPASRSTRIRWASRIPASTSCRSPASSRGIRYGPPRGAGRPPTRSATMLPAYLGFIDEPYGDGSAIPTYYVCADRQGRGGRRAVGRGRRRGLCGVRHLRRLADVAMVLEGPGGGAQRPDRALANALPVSDRKLSLEFKMKRFLGGQDLPPEEAHLWWRIVLGEAQKLDLYTPQGAGQRPAPAVGQALPRGLLPMPAPRRSARPPDVPRLDDLHAGRSDDQERPDDDGALAGGAGAVHRPGADGLSRHGSGGAEDEGRPQEAPDAWRDVRAPAATRSSTKRRSGSRCPIRAG